MKVAVVGAGRVGTAIGVLLARAGHEVVAVSGRAATAARVASYLPGVPLLDPVEAATRAELVVLGVPDDLLGPMIRDLTQARAWRNGAWVSHVSGANGLAVLDPVRAVGARRLAIHPLQTFPDVEAALASIPGCWMAVTAEDADGDRLGADLARDVGANPFSLGDEKRPLYHAAAVFASNDVVAVSAIAERLFSLAGLPDPNAAMLPLQKATVRNVGRVGAGLALTGPAVRGDVGTIQRNLQALADDAPETVDAYVVLCRVLLALAVDGGRLAPEGREAVEKVLAGWS
jgi:predicted short-subunit dehydrogenase-like oxidoreductase (DUF2520 family)